jgi:hypothetical protein
MAELEKAFFDLFTYVSRGDEVVCALVRRDDIEQHADVIEPVILTAYHLPDRIWWRFGA